MDVEWNGPNYLGFRQYAEDLAKRIRKYWADQGYDVQVWVEAERHRGYKRSNIQMLYSIRSDLVNGLPVQKQRMAA